MIRMGTLAAPFRMIVNPSWGGEEVCLFHCEEERKGGGGENEGGRGEKEERENEPR